jgi:glycosyltransferase involved in cell wall biosynthesis
LFVGQVERHKGVFVLLDAWRKSELAGVEGAELEIVGNGTALEEARAEGAAGVTFSGALHGEPLLAAYDRASFLVVPSIVIENQPTVILEAMSRGVPVVAAAVGGIPELLTENDTGYLVPPKDPAALAAGLRRAASAASTPTIWDAMSRACIEWARSRGTAAHVAALETLYKIR